MQGDKLARGARHANFALSPDPNEPVSSGHARVEVEKPKQEFACKDCPFVGATASEFTDHVRVCPVNPVRR